MYCIGNDTLVVRGLFLKCHMAVELKRYGKGFVLRKDALRPPVGASRIFRQRDIIRDWEWRHRWFCLFRLSTWFVI